MRRLGSELRQRKHLKVIQDLDAFPKVPESYQETTASGGTGFYSCILIKVVFILPLFCFFF
jgi:hypothetical protein